MVMPLLTLAEAWRSTCPLVSILYLILLKVPVW